MYDNSPAEVKQARIVFGTRGRLRDYQGLISMMVTGRLHPLALPVFSRYFPAAVAKVYIVSFRILDDRRPSMFIVLAENMKSAIKMAWEHGGPGFQSRFDKTTTQAEQMKEGALRVL